MLNVKTPEEVYTLLRDCFPAAAQRETVTLDDACGRILYEDIKSTEYVPSFDRSTVDGYAVRSSDTFGCSDAIPALLTLPRLFGLTGIQICQPISDVCTLALTIAVMAGILRKLKNMPDKA